MEQFATEEQQVEAIKRFWKDNGMAIVVGAVLGLGGLYGWRWYTDNQIASKEAASASYQTIVESLNADNTAQAKDFVAQSDSGYAALTALQLAKVAVDNNDLAEATKQLELVVAKADSAVIKSVANLRLARVQAEQSSYDAALASLEKVTQEAFKAQVLEIKGDIFVKQNMLDKARAAYTESLTASADNRLVKMKLDNLAVAANG